MSQDHFYIIRCYRKLPGDVGIQEFPTFEGDLDEAFKAASDLFMAHFNDKRRPSRERPLRGDLLDKESNIVLRFLFGASGKVERVIEPGRPNFVFERPE